MPPIAAKTEGACRRRGDRGYLEPRRNPSAVRRGATRKKKSFLSFFLILYFSERFVPPRQLPTTAPLSLMCVCVRVCRSVCTNIYKRSRPRAHVPKKKKGTPFREKIARSSREKRIPPSGAFSECLCLPFFLPSLLFFLSFRHSEYVVPILTGVPFSSVKMKNQKALDLRSSAKIKGESGRCTVGHYHIT